MTSSLSFIVVFTQNPGLLYPSPYPGIYFILNNFWSTLIPSDVSASLAFFSLSISRHSLSLSQRDLSWEIFQITQKII